MDKPLEGTRVDRVDQRVEPTVTTYGEKAGMPAVCSCGSKAFAIRTMADGIDTERRIPISVEVTCHECGHLWCLRHVDVEVAWPGSPSTLPHDTRIKREELVEALKDRLWRAVVARDRYIDHRNYDMARYMDGELELLKGLICEYSHRQDGG